MTRTSYWHGQPVRRLPLVMAVVIALFAAALALNLFVLPENQVVSSMYAIPILVAAHWFSPRRIVFIGLAGVGLYLLNAYIERRPAVVWPFGVLALGVVTYLGVLFADQKATAARRAVEVEESHRRLQEFLGMVGHDLAGALTGVLGYAELATQTFDGPATKSRAEAEAAIAGAVRRMRRLIDDLRDAASVGTGHFVIDPGPMDLSAVLEDVINEQRLTAVQQRLVFSTPGEMKGNWDEPRLSQLFANLISNAIKYSDPDGQIDVRLYTAGREAVVSVADQGAGVPIEQQDFLFRPFYRRDETHDVSGMGLGLYIAKAIADAHHSRIWVESTPGQGSTFFVSLPLPTDPSRSGSDAIRTRDVSDG